MPRQKHLDPDDVFQPAFFRLPLPEVARNFGVCETVMKNFARAYGLNRWPFRKVSALDKAIKRTAEDIEQAGSEMSPVRGKSAREYLRLLMEERDRLLGWRPKSYTPHFRRRQRRMAGLGHSKKKPILPVSTPSVTTAPPTPPIASSAPYTPDRPMKESEPPRWPTGSTEPITQPAWATVTRCMLPIPPIRPSAFDVVTSRGSGEIVSPIPRRVTSPPSAKDRVVPFECAASHIAPLHETLRVIMSKPS